MEGQMNDERRTTQIPAEFRAGEIQGRGEVRNVSPGGLFVGTRVIPEEGASAKVRIVAPGKVPVEVMGLVWWVVRSEVPWDGRSGFGLRVLDEDEGYRRFVDSIR
jgi:hypothetical protein